MFRRYIILSQLLAVLGIYYWWGCTTQQPEYFIADFSDLSAIQVQTPIDTFTVQRSAEQWHIDQYPVSTTALNAFFLTLQEVEVVHTDLANVRCEQPYYLRMQLSGTQRYYVVGRSDKETQYSCFGYGADASIALQVLAHNQFTLAGFYGDLPQLKSDWLDKSIWKPTSLRSVELQFLQELDQSWSYNQHEGRFDFSAQVPLEDIQSYLAFFQKAQFYMLPEDFRRIHLLDVLAPAQQLATLKVQWEGSEPLELHFFALPELPQLLHIYYGWLEVGGANYIIQYFHWDRLLKPRSFFLATR